jgi:hypothetical protein
MKFNRLLSSSPLKDKQQQEEEDHLLIMASLSS